MVLMYRRQREAEDREELFSRRREGAQVCMDVILYFHRIRTTAPKKRVEVHTKFVP